MPTGLNMAGGYPMAGGFATDRNCICSFPTLVILILIVLQFSRCREDDCDDHEGRRCFPVGNGILFIIALFFLSCAGCGRGGAY